MQNYKEQVLKRPVLCWRADFQAYFVSLFSVSFMGKVKVRRLCPLHWAYT